MFLFDHGQLCEIILISPEFVCCMWISLINIVTVGKIEAKLFEHLFWTLARPYNSERVMKSIYFQYPKVSGLFYVHLQTQMSVLWMTYHVVNMRNASTPLARIFVPVHLGMLAMESFVKVRTFLFELCSRGSGWICNRTQIWTISPPHEFQIRLFSCVLM